MINITVYTVLIKLFIAFQELPSMKTDQTYSHGLLFSVSPALISSLHIKVEDGKDAFDWEAYEAEMNGDSLAMLVYRYLKTTATMWGLIKVH